MIYSNFLLEHTRTHTRTYALRHTFRGAKIFNFYKSNSQLLCSLVYDDHIISGQYCVLSRLQLHCLLKDNRSFSHYTTLHYTYFVILLFYYARN